MHHSCLHSCLVRLRKRVNLIIFLGIQITILFVKFSRYNVMVQYQFKDFCRVSYFVFFPFFITIPINIKFTFVVLVIIGIIGIKTRIYTMCGKSSRGCSRPLFGCLTPPPPPTVRIAPQHFTSATFHCSPPPFRQDCGLLPRTDTSTNQNQNHQPLKSRLGLASQGIAIATKTRSVNTHKKQMFEELWG